MRADSTHPRSETIVALPAFQLRHRDLQRFPVRLMRSRVIVTFVFPQRIIDIGGSLINRRDNRACRRIRLLAHMNSIGGKTHDALLALSHTCEAGSLRGWLRDPRALPEFNCPGISFGAGS